MNISVLNKHIQTVKADALIVNLFEGVSLPGGATGAVDGATNGAISQLIQLGDFKGKLNEIAVVYTHGLIPSPRVILVGLGKASDFTLDKARQASGTAARKAKELGCKTVASIAHGAGIGGLNPREAAQATIEGAILGTYTHTEQKSRADQSAIEQLFLLTADAAQLPALEAGAKDGEIIATAQNLTRTLINRPPNVINPASFAAIAQDVAAQTGLACTVLTEKEIAAEKMGGLMGISQGTANPPRFVVMEHRPAGNTAPPLVLIGKGVTFDTGGITLKPGENMGAMKGDMSGAAAVLGAMQAIAKLGVSRPVVGLMPLVENMPDGAAYRPSDVLTMMSGLTVEIISTDAEGRLILADALHYAKRFNPAGVVDIATLTGAAGVALGKEIAAGAFFSDEDWAQKVQAAASAAGERVWRMPLFPEYAEAIRSDTADIKNSGGRTGGVGTSAWFLRRFVEGADGNPVYPWAHIDMAPMDFSTKTTGYLVRGAWGFGVRTFVELAQKG
ncbi:MAG: leucyl aminopeptidase [Anaerolineae bacterium]